MPSLNRHLFSPGNNIFCKAKLSTIIATSAAAFIGVSTYYIYKKVLKCEKPHNPSSIKKSIEARKRDITMPSDLSANCTDILSLNELQALKNVLQYEVERLMQFPNESYNIVANPIVSKIGNILIIASNACVNLKSLPNVFRSNIHVSILEMMNDLSVPSSKLSECSLAMLLSKSLIFLANLVRHVPCNVHEQDRLNLVKRVCENVFNCLHLQTDMHVRLQSLNVLINLSNLDENHSLLLSNLKLILVHCKLWSDGSMSMHCAVCLAAWKLMVNLSTNTCTSSYILCTDQILDNELTIPDHLDKIMFQTLETKLCVIERMLYFYRNLFNTIMRWKNEEGIRIKKPLPKLALVRHLRNPSCFYLRLKALQASITTDSGHEVADIIAKFNHLTTLMQTGNLLKLDILCFQKSDQNRIIGCVSDKQSDTIDKLLRDIPNLLPSKIESFFHNLSNSDSSVSSISSLDLSSADDYAMKEENTSQSSQDSIEPFENTQE